jgi:hypothetical protein
MLTELLIVKTAKTYSYHWALWAYAALRMALLGHPLGAAVPLWARRVRSGPMLPTPDPAVRGRDDREIFIARRLFTHKPS